MSYSDEPNVISERKKSPVFYGVIALLVLFFLTLAAVALYPRYIDFRKHNATFGPNDGIVYFIRFEGDRYSMEIPRTEEQDYHLTFYIRPVRETTAWRPENYVVRYRPRIFEHDWETLEWDAELGRFGPSELRFHPNNDFELDIEIRKNGEQVWEGRRWAFGGGAHAH